MRRTETRSLNRLWEPEYVIDECYSGSDPEFWSGIQIPRSSGVEPGFGPGGERTEKRDKNQFWTSKHRTPGPIPLCGAKDSGQGAFPDQDFT